MSFNTKGRIWRFAGFEYDESSRQLKTQGRTVDVEPKPLEVLELLLLHAGEVVTKEELLEAVWPGLNVVEGSLATAVSKLRKALEDEDAALVVTVPRVGYKLGVPAQAREVSGPGFPELGLKAGDAVPGRDQWMLVRCLDASGSSEVWVGEHPKTGHARVFKFAADGLRLKGLKREVTLARVLTESLGERPEFVRVLEWNFERAPYFLESEYCGESLSEWAERAGGLREIPWERRLAVVIGAARGVALAHEAGVLHKDLKPANILLAPSGQVRVADFGSAALLDPARLKELGITQLGFTKTIEGDSLTGTLMYLAPEVLSGQTPTALADVYALGVILYQMAVGDFRRPLAPGWEEGVEDAILREDIAAAAAGDPARRLTSARVLVERLETLEQRRTARGELDRALERAALAERHLQAARARRPWLIAALLTLVAGLGAALYLYRNAIHERDRANLQMDFLANDLLGRGNPFQSGRSNESLADAVAQAAPGIDRKFANAPDVAARLHLAIARALDARTDWPGARREYERAAALFKNVEGENSPQAVTVNLQRAAMEARTYEKGSLDKARDLLQEQETIMARAARPDPQWPVWLASARGMIALIGNDAKRAAEQFELAYQGAGAFEEQTRLTFQQRLAFAHIRLGNGAKAEGLFRELVAAFTRTAGAESPNVLRVRLNLAQAYMIQGKNKEAVAETSAIYPAYVARLGEEHELSMQVLTTRAQCEGTLGMWPEAIRDGLKVHALAVKKQGPLSFFAVSSLADAALAQCRGGQVPEGSANARKAWEASAKAFGPRAGLTGGVAYALASCEINQGRLDEASRLLAEIDVPAVAQLAGIADWGANVALAQAEIAQRKGDTAAARRHLAAAEPVFLRSDAEPYQRQAVERLRRLVK